MEFLGHAKMKRALYLCALLFFSYFCLQPNFANAFLLRGGSSSSSSCDSICQFAKQMIANGDNIKELDVASNSGNFNAVVLPITAGCSGDTTNYFDGAATLGGTPCTGTGGSPFASDAGASTYVAQGTTRTVSPFFSFGTGGVSPYNGQIFFMGCGHASCNDSTGFIFDSEAAAANRVLGGTGGSWAVATKPCRYVTTQPAWNHQGSDGSGNWCTTNADGNEIGPSIHSGFGIISAPNNEWMVSGYAATHASGVQGGEYITNTSNNCYGGTPATQSLCSSTVIGNTAYYVHGLDTGAAGSVYNPVDGNVYSFGVNGEFGVYTSPLTTGSFTELSSFCSTVTDSGIGWNTDVIFPDPVNNSNYNPQSPSGQVDYFSWGGFWSGVTGEQLVISNISSSHGPCPTLFSITNNTTSHTGDCAGQSKCFPGSCYDPDTKQILVPNGAGFLYQVNFHGSDTTSNWTLDDDTRTLTGDTMALFSATTPANFYLACAVLPSGRAGGGGVSVVIINSFGHVFMEVNAP